MKLFKTNLRDIRKQLYWKRFVYEFSGTIFLFVIAFIMYAVISMQHEKVYLANDSLTYGIEASESAESVGFKDGDKLVTINGEKIIEFTPRYFLVDLLLADNPYVDIERGSTKIRLQISDEHKRIIIDDRKNFIKAKNHEKLELTHEKKSLGEISTNFYGLLKSGVHYFKTLLFPPQNVNGYANIKAAQPTFPIFNFEFFIHVFCLLLSILVVINLLPIPGLDMGNAIIALVERKKKFPAKKLFRIRILGIIVVICWILLIELMYDRSPIFEFSRYF
ncbi:MAG: site-2 protease family protein [Kordia sp.]|uniref:site-2 protease family protein n=1 Tax=Kordia sp. TaxID=1965332 RepID=UPI003859C7A8